MDLVDSDIEALPNSIERFLEKRDLNRPENSQWSYFSYAYSQGFTALVDAALGAWPRQDYLIFPIFHVGRHSIELSLKEAILDYAGVTGLIADIGTHNLLSLFDMLAEQTLAAGFPNDEWTQYCRELIVHIHEGDPDGLRFRYPADRQLEPYEQIDVELRGLVNAHWHVTLMADASINMLHETRPM